MTDLYIDPLVGIVGLASNTPDIQVGRGIEPETGVLYAAKTSLAVGKFNLESADSPDGLLRIVGSKPAVSMNRGMLPATCFAVVVSSAPGIKTSPRSRSGLAAVVSSSGASIPIERTS